jgi:hypothetical protein
MTAFPELRHRLESPETPLEVLRVTNDKYGEHLVLQINTLWMKQH